MTGRLTICGTCDGPGAGNVGRVLAPGWDVCLHDCLAACAGLVAPSVQAQGKATFVFAGVTAGDVADRRAFLDLYDASPDFWIEEAHPAGHLRSCLGGKGPALPVMVR